MDERSGQGPVGLKLVAAYKLAGAGLLFAVGIGVFRLLKRDVAEGLEEAIAQLRLDPHGHYLHIAVSKVAGVDRGRLKAIGFGTFFYALLSTVEGLGLLFRRRWASYLTVFATGSLIPLEGYELARKFKAIKLVVLILNVAILAYLIWRLIEERKEGGRPGGATGPAAPGGPDQTFSGTTKGAR